MRGGGVKDINGGGRPGGDQQRSREGASAGEAEQAATWPPVLGGGQRETGTSTGVTSANWQPGTVPEVIESITTGKSHHQKADQELTG